MDAPAADFRLLRFWTSEWPRHLGFEMWRDLLKRKLLDVDVEAVNNTPFEVRAHLRVLDEVRFGWGAVDASLYRRTRDAVAADNDDFVLFMNLEGSFIASQSGRDINLRPGDAYVMACSEVASYDRPTNGKLLTIRLPSAPLIQAVPNIYDRTACVLPREMESLRLLAAYIQSLDNNVPLTNPQNRALVSRYTNDLVALVLGATKDATEAAEARGLAALRLRSIKAYATDNLSRPDLSIGEVAKHHRISSRQVQRLFGNEGITFSEFLLGVRLDRVRRRLTNDRYAKTSISEIAFQSGFRDLSHFNRDFRARYGMTPSELRFRDTVKNGGGT
jgi:AraC-like DNA-binding protein